MAVVVLFVVIFAILGQSFILSFVFGIFTMSLYQFLLGELYTERGSLLSTTIFVYAATAPVSGYFGGSLYARMGGKVNKCLFTFLIFSCTFVVQVWIRQMLMSAFLLPTLVCGTAFLVNFIAIYYHASR